MSFYRPTPGFSAITSAGHVSSATVSTTGAALAAGPITIPSARGLFCIRIDDVAGGAANLTLVMIEGGLSSKFGDPGNLYTIITGSPLTILNSVSNIGTLVGSQTTMAFIAASGLTTYTLTFDASGNASPTIQNTAGAAPAGAVNIRIIYFNYPPFRNM
jgi:hypothetical protein